MKIRLLVLSLIAISILAFSGVSNHSTTPANPPLSTSHQPGPTHFTHPMTPATNPSGANALSDSAVTCPEPSIQCLASFNWGGYGICDESSAACAAAFGASPPAPTAGQVTSVSGTWTVPSLTYPTNPYNRNTNCTDAENTWYDNSVWVGIDGLISPTVEQTGTSSDCFYGTLSYYAWYEFYPAGSLPVTITVNPGDTITASVSCTATSGGANCMTTITDVTGHQSFTSPSTFVPGALLDSAEWIQESAYYEGFLALSPVTPVTFHDAIATINGQTHPIGQWGSQVYWLVMVTYNFPYAPLNHQSFNVKAKPSALYFGGNSFSSTFVSSGP